jgi:hypothetical protein
MAQPKVKGRTPRAVPQATSNVVSIRGTMAWRNWLYGLADHCRLKSPDLIDRALIAYAKAEGYKAPAPART